MPKSEYKNTDDYAVVVGIMHYPDFGNLNGPVEDARAFHQWLTDIDKGSIPADNCVLIESVYNPQDEFPSRPIQVQIDNAFGKVWRRIKATQKQARRFYFYFNGHGIGVKQSNTALLMANYGIDFFRNSAISSEKYLDTIISSGRMKEVVFLMDCCRNQLLGVSGLDPTFDWPADSAATGQTAIWIGYAAEYQSKAWEAEVGRIDEDEDGSRFRGHFSNALLKGLEGAAADFITGYITPESLKTYLEKETPKIALEYKHNQRARVENNFPSDIETYFGATKFLTEVHCEIHLKPREGNVVLINGRALRILSKALDPLPWTPLLPTDTYILKDEATGDTQEFVVSPTFSNQTVKINF